MQRALSTANKQLARLCIWGKEIQSLGSVYAFNSAVLSLHGVSVVHTCIPCYPNFHHRIQNPGRINPIFSAFPPHGIPNWVTQPRVLQIVYKKGDKHARQASTWFADIGQDLICMSANLQIHMHLQLQVVCTHLNMQCLHVVSPPPVSRYGWWKPKRTRDINIGSIPFYFTRLK